jgi:hypothetical protein
MKICSKCHFPKKNTEFARNRSKTGSRQSYCRKCKRSYDAAYYKINHKRMRAQITAAKALKIEEARKKVLEYLRRNPCVDCGESDPIVLDFDHVRGEKVAYVATMIKDGLVWSRIEEEIAKCDIRCANCHRRKTAKQKGFYKWRQGS